MRSYTVERIPALKDAGTGVSAPPYWTVSAGSIIYDERLPAFPDTDKGRNDAILVSQALNSVYHAGRTDARAAIIEALGLDVPEFMR